MKKMDKGEMGRKKMEKTRRGDKNRKTSKGIGRREEKKEE